MADYPDTGADPVTPGPPRESCKSAYERLAVIREPFLRRARLGSKVTIPSIVPEVGINGSEDLPVPFQSVGARGVNNLAAKLVMALFPPNAPFFQFKVDPYVLENFRGVRLAKNKADARQEIEQNLVKASEAILTELETAGFRVVAYEGARHLVVAGNVLLFYGEDGPRSYHLDQYVVRRDPLSGKARRIIIRECIADEDVPELEQPSRMTDENMSRSAEKTHELYTHCEWSADYDSKGREKKTGRWSVYQECDDCEVRGSYGTYSEDEFEYMALRVNNASGEDYARSYVDEYIGDLLSLEGLTQAIVEGSAAAARIIPLVDPAGLTNIDEVSGAANGQYVPGRAQDITMAKLDKYSDFQIAGNTAKAMEGRLGFAFMLNSAIQRDAERVTAEEIRFMAQELEEALGGVYSLASREFQLPLVRLLIARMTRQRRLPPIPPKIIRPAVVTGVEALGRGNDLNRLNQAFGALNVIFPNASATYCKGLEVTNRVLTAAGIRTENLVKTPDEVQQEQQQAQANELTKHLGPNIVTQAGGVLKDQAAPAQ